jgi:hypothetical protein
MSDPSVQGDVSIDAHHPSAELNPFASRYVRPGVIDYLFDDDADPAQIVARFYAAGRRGAIVGPHGSGKTTLLAALVPAIAARGGAVSTITLRDRGEGFPQLAGLNLAPESVLVVDGYEQLGWWRRFRLHRAVRRAGAGLLVTAHRTVDLPTLYATWASPEIAARLVRGLVAAHAPQSGLKIDDAEIARRLAVHGGDVRELLFGLYDLYESQRP